MSRTHFLIVRPRREGEGESPSPFPRCFLISTSRVTVFRARDDAETIPSCLAPWILITFPSAVRKTRRNLAPPRARVIYVMIPRDKGPRVIRIHACLDFSLNKMFPWYWFAGFVSSRGENSGRGYERFSRYWISPWSLSFSRDRNRRRLCPLSVDKITRFS